MPQCGFCQPAQILTAVALLQENPDPDEEEIVQGMNGVLCRCGDLPGHCPGREAGGPGRGGDHDYGQDREKGDEPEEVHRPLHPGPAGP